MSAMEALRAAQEAGIAIGVEAGELALEADAEPPEAVLKALKDNKRGIVDLLMLRDKLEPEWLVTLLARPKPESDEPWRWNMRCNGVRRFVAGGWDKSAADLGWTHDELFALGTSRVHGAAWFILDDRVQFVTADQIMVYTKSGLAQPIYKGIDYTDWHNPVVPDVWLPSARKRTPAPEDPPAPKPEPTREAFLEMLGYRPNGSHVKGEKR